jgi:DNA-binding MarR family transcriptional regulator
MDKQEQLIVGFTDLVNKMTWLNRPLMEERLKGYKNSEIHCIEYVGGTEDPNVTKLAESFYMTRGAISKLTKKLMEKGALESYRKPDNKKEIYFRLTARGSAVNRAHEQLHKEFLERDRTVFDQVTEEQIDSMLSFVGTYSSYLDKVFKERDQAAQG